MAEAIEVCIRTADCRANILQRCLEDVIGFDVRRAALCAAYSGRKVARRADRPHLAIAHVACESCGAHAPELAVVVVNQRSRRGILTLASILTRRRRTLVEVVAELTSPGRLTATLERAPFTGARYDASRQVRQRRGVCRCRLRCRCRREFGANIARLRTERPGHKEIRAGGRAGSVLLGLGTGERLVAELGFQPSLKISTTGGRKMTERFRCWRWRRRRHGRWRWRFPTRAARCFNLRRQLSPRRLPRAPTRSIRAPLHITIHLTRAECIRKPQLVHTRPITQTDKCK